MAKSNEPPLNIFNAFLGHYRCAAALSAIISSARL